MKFEYNLLLLITKYISYVVFSFCTKSYSGYSFLDPENKFINLTAQDANRHYQRREGDSIQWVVYVHAYPEPTLKW